MPCFCEKNIDAQVSLQKFFFLCATYSYMIRQRWASFLMLDGFRLKGIEDCGTEGFRKCGPFMATPVHYAISLGADSDSYPLLKVLKTLCDSSTDVSQDSLCFENGLRVILPLHLFILNVKMMI